MQDMENALLYIGTSFMYKPVSAICTFHVMNACNDKVDASYKTQQLDKHKSEDVDC